jgi:hypothetical protein
MAVNEDRNEEMRLSGGDQAEMHQSLPSFSVTEP